jgi:hypothetical protein
VSKVERGMGRSRETSVVVAVIIQAWNYGNMGLSDDEWGLLQEVGVWKVELC